MPAESTILPAHVDQPISRPSRKMRCINARYSRRSLVSGVGQPGRLFPSDPNVSLFLWKKSQQIVTQFHAPMCYQLGGRVSYRRRVAAFHQQTHCKRCKKTAQRHVSILPRPSTFCKHWLIFWSEKRLWDCFYVRSGVKLGLLRTVRGDGAGSGRRVASTSRQHLIP